MSFEEIRKSQGVLDDDGTSIPTTRLTEVEMLAMAAGGWNKKCRIYGLSYLADLPLSGLGSDIASSSRGFEEEINNMRRTADELNATMPAQVEHERNLRAASERDLQRELKKLRRSNKSTLKLLDEQKEMFA
ncbi:hypothetical protein CDL15_Pgr022608 [Punica granatum]|nr:hypothetical protein CDL15_Pgr022608 [Punica granatum]